MAETRLQGDEQELATGARSRRVTCQWRALGPLALGVLLGCDPSQDKLGTDARTPVDTQPNASSTDAAADVGAFGAGATHAGAMANETDAGAMADNPKDSGVDAGHAPDAGSGARWSSYGYDQHNTQVNPRESSLTSGSVAQLREQWRIRIPNGATSTPIVYDGHVYFGGWDGNVYAADALSGEIRWQRKVTNNQVRSTPAVTAERVYVAAGRSVVALSRSDGVVQFETELASHPETLLDGSPKLVDGLVIQGVASVDNTFDKPDYTSVGAVVAVDALTGALVWRVPTTGEGPGPCVGGGGASVWSTAAIDEELGLAFIGTGQGHEEPASNCSDSLLAIHYRRSHQGERLAWHQQYTQGDVYAANLLSVWGPDADIGAAPNLFEAAGRPLVGAGDKGGSYRAFDRRTGEPVWRTDLEVGSVVKGGGVMTTAAVHHGMIYVSSNQVDVDDKVLFDPENIPAVSTVYALDVATGELLWKERLPGLSVGSFAVAADVLYHNVSDGSVFARDPATGKVLWSTKLELPVGVGPSVVDGRVYVSAGFGIGVSASEPSVRGAAVISFGLEKGPLKVWDAEVETPRILSKEECRTAIEQVSEWPSEQRPSAACSTCLCDCNATAAGHCDTCWLQAPCAVSYCSVFPTEEVRDCMSWLCTTKLLPSNVFERGAQVAPCMIQCADVCGF